PDGAKDQLNPPFEDYVMYNIKAEQPVTVYALVDPDSPPAWLVSDGWTDTGLTVKTEGGKTIRVYGKAFDAGIIDLKRALQGTPTTYVFDQPVTLVDAPDIVDLIRFGTEIIYVRQGNHTLLKEQLAFFLYA